MFQSLRRRLTLLYAGATLVLLALLGIGMVVWLNNQFTQAADAALYQRLIHEISDRQLPMPLTLGDYHITTIGDEEHYDISVDQLSPFLPTTMPSFAAAFLRNPGSASTYAISANPQQIAIRDGTSIPPFPSMPPAYLSPAKPRIILISVPSTTKLVPISACCRITYHKTASPISK